MFRKVSHFFVVSIDEASPDIAGPFSSAHLRTLSARALLRSYPDAALSLLDVGPGRKLTVTPWEEVPNA